MTESKITIVSGIVYEVEGVDDEAGVVNVELGMVSFVTGAVVAL